MDPASALLFALVAAFFVKNAAVDTMAVAKGQTPPSHERWMKRREQRGEAPQAPKGDSALGWWARTAWADAGETWAERSHARHQRRMAWLREQEPHRTEEWLAKQRRKASSRRARRQRFAEARGLAWDRTKATGRTAAQAARARARRRSSPETEEGAAGSWPNVDTDTLGDSPGSSPTAEENDPVLDGPEETTGESAPAGEQHSPQQQPQTGVVLPFARPEAGGNGTLAGGQGSHEHEHEQDQPQWGSLAADPPTTGTEGAHPMGYSIEGGTAAVAQALTQASDQLEAYRSEFTALVESLAAADWSGAPLDALESAQESLATAAEQITTAAELIGTGGAQVRDAYEAHSHVGTKESVMQA